ncbi:hypothetical protein [Nocardia asiatica]|uniref:hypothetical protein n=1 Tax=Nocardia asiatica TaxID=209252 RepID=UPI003EDEA6E6
MVWTLCCAVFRGALLRKKTVERIFGLRRPTDAERSTLVSAWEAVTRAAGIESSRYSLCVRDSPTLDAFTAPRRIIGVTSEALAIVKPPELRAILARAFGHSLVEPEPGARFVSLYGAPFSIVLSRLFGAIRFLADPLARFSL